MMAIRPLVSVDEAMVDALSDVLIDCVDGGASVSFMAPLTRERANAFWRMVAVDVDTGARALLVAEDELGVCGTVQLVLDVPENQPHRADLAKMLVHRRARRLGLGAALMQAAEGVARECGKSCWCSIPSRVETRSDCIPVSAGSVSGSFRITRSCPTELPVIRRCSIARSTDSFFDISRIQ